jgi:phosphoenolpyruvate carboxykinase (ATP)
VNFRSHARHTGMDINISRSVIDGIHSGELLDAEYENFDVFNLQVPKSLTGVSSDALNPVNCWDDKSAFGETLKGLAKRFVDNFVQYVACGWVVVWCLLSSSFDRL